MNYYNVLMMTTGKTMVLFKQRDSQSTLEVTTTWLIKHVRLDSQKLHTKIVHNNVF